MAHDPLQYNARNTGLALNRLNAFPIDSSELWDKVGPNGKLLWHDPSWGSDTTNDVEVDTPQDLADKYADCSISYTGQIISVVDPTNGATFVFKIDDDGTEKKATLVCDGNGGSGSIIYHDSTYVEVGETQSGDNFNCYGAKIDLSQWSNEFGDNQTRYLNSLKVSCRGGNYNNLTTAPLYAKIGIMPSSNIVSWLEYSNEALSFGLDKVLEYTFPGLSITKNSVIVVCFSETKDPNDEYQQVGLKVLRDSKSNCGAIVDSDYMTINDTWMPTLSMKLYNEKEIYVSYIDQDGVERTLGENDGIANHQYVKDQLNNLQTVSTQYIDSQNQLLHRYSDPPYFYYNITQENKVETVRFCSPYNIWIDWGDGSDIQHVYNSGKNTVVNFSHTYVNSGLYSCYFYGSAIDIGVLSEESNISSLQMVIGDFSALDLQFLGYTPGMGRNYDHRGGFENCKNLMNIYIPSECLHIGNNCFKNCTSLRGITFFRQKTSALNSIHKYVFSGCTSMTSLNLRNTLVTSTETSTFEGSSITTISFPENYITMFTNAFGSSLSEEKIVNLNFYGSRNLTIQAQPDNLKLNVYTCFGYPETYTYNGETKEHDGYVFPSKTDEALYNMMQDIKNTMVTAVDT